jgi:DNA-binding NtrC family response regulator
MRTVLVIDDNPAVVTALDMLFGLREIRTLRAGSPDEGLAVLERERVDLIVQDMNFHADTTSGEEGVTLFRAVRGKYPDLPVILLTAWTHLPTAVELVKAGAADYLSKPWDDAKLLATVENLLELGESTREVARLRGERKAHRSALSQRFDLRGLIFAASAMERLVELAVQVARADVPVLITGPNGAGKERIAEIVHANSAVKAGPFVIVNCGALPSELIEAELFGAEAGAYTGANKAREGRFELANGGTLMLDEIGNLPLSGQMKLLRILETRVVKVRVLSATNADLAGMIREGRFREDLFYRLNVIELALPPLAARVDDILPLAEHFLGQTAKLSAEARTALLDYAWPGNVRELKNAIQRASLLCRDGTIQPADLGLVVRAPPPRPLVAAEPDRATIEAALVRANGVISQAAADLGLSRQALYRRIEKLGINGETLGQKVQGL